VARADDLLDRARRSKRGWRYQELESLYFGFGFAKKEGKAHTLFFHPAYPRLRATVTRSSGELPVGYVATAVRLIDAL
jgi:hypothetical protein